MLTKDDLKGLPTSSMHVDAADSAMWFFSFPTIPRLTLTDTFYRKSKRRARTWHVDETGCRDLDAALAVLNGTMTIEEAMHKPDPPAPAATPRRKISLAQQIEEVDRELKMRAAVYPRQVTSGKLRQGEADYQIERLEAVRDTLNWLAKHEKRIKELLAAVGEQEGTTK
jgi:hypothetical protein